MSPEQANMAPGTIVFQYIDTTRYFIGVVLPEEAEQFLNEKERNLINSNTESIDSAPYHIILVLGCFDKNEIGHSLFENMGAHPYKGFPWYVVAEKRYSKIATLDEELALFVAHQRLHSSSPPNILADLRKTSFCFNPKQKEVLGAVLFVREYLLGKTEANLLAGKWEIGEQGELFFNTLKELFPRDEF
jgi:hypothetical protein